MTPGPTWQEIYGVEVSAELISKVTDAIVPELRAWQQRPLDAVYPILYLDAIVVKVRTDHVVVNRPVYIAMAVDVDGRKHVLGLWLGKGDEGAKFWLGVITELKNRGVTDVLVVCCDGLTGFADAIEAVWPNTTVQTCVVHLIRNSIRFCSWKDRKAVTRALKPIYRAATIEAAALALDDFETEWGGQYPAIVDLWRRNLGTLLSVPGLRRRHPQNHLHDQRHRVVELPAPQGHQNPGAFPHRRRRAEDPLFGDPQHREQQKR